MKSLLTILSLVVILTSCGSESGNQPIKNRNVSFRAKYTWLSTVSYNRYVDDEISIIEADSAYRAGDTIRLDQQGQYILLERVK